MISIFSPICVPASFSFLWTDVWNTMQIIVCEMHNPDLGGQACILALSSIYSSHSECWHVCSSYLFGNSLPWELAMHKAVWRIRSAYFTISNDGLDRLNLNSACLLVQEGWCDSVGSVEEIQAKLLKRQEAAAKRERAMAYALANQVGIQLLHIV